MHLVHGLIVDISQSIARDPGVHVVKLMRVKIQENAERKPGRKFE
jgi:hypothetical protein